MPGACGEPKPAAKQPSPKGGGGAGEAGSSGGAGGDHEAKGHGESRSSILAVRPIIPRQPPERALAETITCVHQVDFFLDAEPLFPLVPE